MAIDRIAQVVAPGPEHGEPLALGRLHGRFIRRTMIDPDRAVVTKEQPPLNVGGRRVIRRQARAPGDIGAERSPQRPARIDVIDEIVWRQPVGVIEGIQVAADLQLFQIVHAGDAQGLFLRFAQRRQQQRRQNRNHGNHHQQFNQSEGGIIDPGQGWSFIPKLWIMRKRIRSRLYWFHRVSRFSRDVSVGPRIGRSR